MYLARYSNQPDLGAYLPRLQVPNSLLHSFNQTFFFIITNNQNQNSNQIKNYTKNKNKNNNKSCPSSAVYVSAPHVTISSKESLPPISKSNVKSAAPQIPVSSSFPSLPSFIRHLYKFSLPQQQPPLTHANMSFLNPFANISPPRQLALHHRRNFSTPLPPLAAPNQTPRKRAIRL